MRTENELLDEIEILKNRRTTCDNRDDIEEINIEIQTLRWVLQ